jgi:hypothetical protein
MGRGLASQKIAKNAKARKYTTDCTDRHGWIGATGVIRGDYLPSARSAFSAVNMGF